MIIRLDAAPGKRGVRRIEAGARDKILRLPMRKRPRSGARVVRRIVAADTGRLKTMALAPFGDPSNLTLIDAHRRRPSRPAIR